MTQGCMTSLKFITKFNMPDLYESKEEKAFRKIFEIWKQNASVTHGNTNGLIHLKDLYFIWSFLREQSPQGNFFLEAHSWRTSLKSILKTLMRGKKNMNLLYKVQVHFPFINGFLRLEKNMFFVLQGRSHRNHLCSQIYRAYFCMSCRSFHRDLRAPLELHTTL